MKRDIEELYRELRSAESNECFTSIDLLKLTGRLLEPDADIAAISKEIEANKYLHDKYKAKIEECKKEIEEYKNQQKLRVGKVTFLGSFDVLSDRLIITDPCYNKQTWCQGFLDDPEQGKWLAYIQYRDEGSWGIRNSTLIAVHESCSLKKEMEDGLLYNSHLPKCLDADIGVDSGQAGIFDESKYPDNDPGEYGDTSTFYGRACNATLEGELRANVLEEGCVSRSGDGDGGYRCFYNTNNSNKVDAVEISFYWHDNEMDEEEESVE